MTWGGMYGGCGCTAGAGDDDTDHYNTDHDGGKYSRGDKLQHTGAAEGGVCGGVEELQNDIENVFSRQKENLIRKLAETFNGELGVKVDAKGDIDTIIAELSSKIPNPRSKSGKSTTLPADNAKLSVICKKIANIINDNYGNAIIDVNGTNDYICNKSMEIVHSLMTGMHVEFLSVAKDVKRIMKNIAQLQTWLTANWNAVNDAMNNETDEKVKLKFKKLTNLHDILDKELNRQFVLLQNLTNVTIQPIDDDIIDALKTNKDFKGIVTEIKQSNGATDFADKVAFALRGISNISIVANSVAKALKETGLTLDEYAKTSSIEGLKNKIYELMKDLKSPSGVKLQKFAELSEIIYRNNYLHEDIVKYLSENRKVIGLNEGSYNDDENGINGKGEIGIGGNSEMSSGKNYRSGGGMSDRINDGFNAAANDPAINKAFNDAANKVPFGNSVLNVAAATANAANAATANAAANVSGQDESDDEFGGGNAYGAAEGGATGDRLKMDKRIKKQKVTRDLLNKGFIYRISKFNDNIYRAIDNISHKVGISIPLSDELSDFVKAFDRMEVLEYEGIQMALTGQDKSVNGLDKKSRIVGYLNEIGRRASVLEKGPNGEYFTDISRNIAAINDTIKTYSDTLNMGHTVTGDILGDKSDRLGFNTDDNSNNSSNKSGANELTAGFAGLNAYEMSGVDAYPLNVELESDGFGEDFDGIYGAAEGGAIGGAIGGALLLPNLKLSKNTGNIKRSTMMMKYYFKVAKIRENLKISSLEIKNYSEDYEDLIGEAVGRKIYDINDKAKTDITDANNTVAVVGMNAGGGLTNTLVNAGDIDAAGVRVVNGFGAGNVDKYIEWLELERDTKVKFFKTVEAIDLYLSYVTDGLANNPDDVKDMSDMLDSVKIISKWFSDKSGDDLAKLFDSFPTIDASVKSTIWTQGPPPAPDPDNYFTRINVVTAAMLGDHNKGVPFNESSIQEVLKNARNAVSGVQTLKNIVSVFTTIGNKFGGVDLSKKVNMTPATIYNNLVEYLYVTCIHKQLFVGNDKHPQPGNPRPNNFKLCLRKVVNSDGGVTIDQNNAGFNTHFPSHNSIAVVNATNIVTVRRNVNTAVTAAVAAAATAFPPVVINVRSVNAAATAANNVNVNNTIDDIRKAILAAVLARGGTRIEAVTLSDAVKDAVGIISPGVKAFNKPGVSALPGAGFFPYRSIASVGNSPLIVNAATGDRWNDSTQNYGGDVTETDILFTDVIKAMAAKVLTAVKTYSLFRRPADDRQKIYRNPIRMILGGSEVPELHAEAFELYVRLPLLAEFYKNVFALEDTVPAGFVSQKIVTIIPEFENVWSGLIKVVFDSAKYVQEGSYSQTHIIDIVNCVNDVYKLMKNKSSSNSSGKNITQSAVLEFIAEINRRYGILKSTEVDEYVKERKNRKKRSNDPSYNALDEDTNYEILADEGEPTYNKPAPSDRFIDPNLMTSLANKKSSATTNIIDLNDRDIVLNFRARIDYLFQTVDVVGPPNAPGTMQDIDFNATIKDALREFNKAATKDDKFAIVMKTMQNSNAVSTLSKDKYLLFHETVVAGVNLLDSIRTHVYNYLNSIINAINNASLSGTTPGLGVIPANTYEFKTVTDQINAVIAAAGAGAGLPASADVNQRLTNLINDTFEFGSCDLVSTKVKNGTLMIDTSNLTTLVDTHIATIRYCLDKYRNSVPQNSINSFDTYLNTYEENFVEACLKDINQLGIGKLHEYLAPAPSAFKSLAAKVTITQVYDKLIFNADNTGAVAITDYRAANYKEVVNGVLQNVGNITPITQVGSVFDNNTCIINRFNHILHNYLNMYFDQSNNRIYQNLIEPIVSGHLASAIESVDQTFANGTIINDSVVGALGGGITNNSVIYGSLAFTLRKMMTLRDKNDVARIRVVATLSEVSSNIREKMRVFLPAFVKEFDTIASKADYIKQWINADCTQDAGAFTNNKTLQLLDNLIQACRSVRSTAVNVYRELDDQPQYMETYHNSLVEYKSSNNFNAVTPLSNLLYITNNVAPNTTAPFVVPLGTVEAKTLRTVYSAATYKYVYGVRGILLTNAVVDVNKLSHVKDILTNGNDISDSFSKIDETKYSDFVQNQVKLIRYLNDSRCYKHSTTTIVTAPSTNKTLIDVIPVAAVLNAPIVNGAIPFAYSVGTTVTDTYNLINVSENNNVETSKVLVLTTINNIVQNNAGAGAGLNGRIELQIRNIVDMNVMPINVHALMREVPLVNIYNYSYTFDRLVANEYTTSDIERVRLYSTPATTQEMFAKLLVNPYHIINGKQDFYRFVGTSMVGLTDMNLGRPRYLADQLWNKVLVQTQLHNQQRNQVKLEGGPSSNIASQQALIGVNNQYNQMFKDTDGTGAVASGDRFFGSKLITAPAPVTLYFDQANMVRGRFDTIIVRNMYFTTNVQRMLMKFMRDEFEHIDEPVVSGHTLLDTRMTEYNRYNSYSHSGPYQA
jgi:hypothetical protein